MKKSSLFYKSIIVLLCVLVVSFSFVGNAQKKIKRNSTATIGSTTNRNSSSSSSSSRHSSSSRNHRTASTSRHHQGSSSSTIATTSTKKKNSSSKKTSTKSRQSAPAIYFDIEDEKYEAKFGCNGGTDYFHVVTNSSWEISANTASWGHLYKDGNTLSLRVDPNNSTSAREDNFVIENDYETITVFISQEGRPETTLSLSTTNLSFDSSGGTQTISVNSNSDWRVGVVPNSWGHYTISGNQLKFTADCNSTTSSRSDYFTVVAGDKTVRVNVFQEKRAATLSVSDENLYISSSGETKTITVDSGGEDWVIGTSTAFWGHLSKNGNVLTVTIDPNNSTKSRSDYFTILSGDNRKIIEITQSGASVTNYSSDTNKSVLSNTNDYYNPKESWFKGRFSVGVELFGDLDVKLENKNGDNNGKSHFYNYGAGLVFRIGKFSDILNFSTGAKWMGTGISSDIYENDSNLANFIVVPGNLKLNIFRIGGGVKFYLGGGFEYGFGLKDVDNFMDWNAGLGINSRHVDWYVYFKQFLECNGVRIFDDDNKNRIGTSLTFYF